MKLTFNQDGTLNAEFGGKTVIDRSPAGLLAVDKTLYAPKTATISDKTVTLEYDVGSVTLKAESFEGGRWFRLEVESVPDDAEAFVFGPYSVPGVASTGEVLGAAWLENGGGVCIQSLNPKTLGGYSAGVLTNKTGLPFPSGWPCGLRGGSATLQCTARDM